MNRKFFILAVAALPLAFAQDKEAKEKVQFMHMAVDAQAVGTAAPGPATQMFVRYAPGPMATIDHVSMLPVKGAPYSAEAQTDSVQVLADGNRITNKQTSKMWRDSEGRTRQENALGMAGLWMPEGKDITITTIDDPVSGDHITLNSVEKTATKMTTMSKELPNGGRMIVRSAGGPGSAQSFTVTGAATPGPGGAMFSTSAGPAVIRMKRQAGDGAPGFGASNNFKREDLGTQVIEGVQCQGTRDIVTIPAGQIGNERPIEMVTERWFSKELGFDVLRKHSDPRSGETTYRVTNINRSEQPKSLFEVPPDYKLEDFSATINKPNVLFKHESTTQKE